MFTYRRRVQFAETDLAGIVHFSVMFLYMEEAEHALWRAAGLSIADPGSDYAWPRLSASLEFRNPLRFEEEFDVQIQISALKTRTLEYACTIVRGDTVIARGSMTAACARKAPDGSMRAAELPADITTRLKNARG
jgi:YbgC/YbaW family acyl-CoA thioester hydrolase